MAPRHPLPAALTDRAAGEQPYVDPGPGSGPPDALVLDIGGDIGALIVYADEPWLGAEVDLSPVGVPRSHHLHTMVRRRRVSGYDVFAGLYPEVQQGSYTIWAPTNGSPLGTVEVIGGQVAEFDARTGQTERLDK